MRVTTKIVSNIETGEVLEHLHYEYVGPVELACGATDEQKQAQSEESKLASEQRAILQTMQTQQAKVFAEDQNIMQSLQTVLQPMIDQNKAILASLEPTIEAGPNQKGFSAAEEAGMRTDATELTSGMSDKAVRTIDAQTGGNSDSFVPSGAQDQLRAMTRQEALNKDAELQTGITKDNYAVGRQNYASALDESNRVGSSLATMTGALSGSQSSGISAGNMLTGAENAATGGAEASMKGATDIATADNAWMGPVFGMLGGVAGAALGKPPK